MILLETLLADIRKCAVCEEHLEHGVRPVVQASRNARILIAGQAPGRKVHETGIPFDDPSGDRLRDWMGLLRGEFYDPEVVAIVPMGFCFPGTRKGSGDLPPRPECAPLWRSVLLDALPNIRLTLVIGSYAQRWHLETKASVTQNVVRWESFGESVLPLPHPSPRNNIWMKKNPWFAERVLPELRERVRVALL